MSDDTLDVDAKTGTADDALPGMADDYRAALRGKPRGTQMDSEDAIEREFKAGELDHIYAVQRLENLGYLPKDAENKVEGWTAEPEIIDQHGVKHPF